MLVNALNNLLDSFPYVLITQNERPNRLLSYIWAEFSDKFPVNVVPSPTIEGLKGTTRKKIALTFQSPSLQFYLQQRLESS